MKYLALILLSGFTYTSTAQEDTCKYLQKVESIDSIITTLYAVISGEKKEERNWELFRHLYKDGANMIPSGYARDSSYHVRYDTPDEYIESSGDWLIKNGFFENEIHREVQQFGNIAHVFSTYHCFHSSKDKKPFMRGINSIQLVYDGQRWWIVNIFWAQESEETPIPVEFLPKS